MGWVRKASSEVRFDANAWVRIWVGIDNVRANEEAKVIIAEYERKRDELKTSSELSDNEKVKGLKELRKEYVGKLEADEESILQSCAHTVASNALSETGGIKIEYEIGERSSGTIWMEDVLYGGSDDSPQEELGIEENNI